MSMLAAVPPCQSTFHFFSKGGQFSASSAFVGASLATSTFVVLTFSFSEGASFATSFHVSYSFPTKGRPFSASCLSFSFSPHRTDFDWCWAIRSFAHIGHMSTLAVFRDHSLRVSHASSILTFNLSCCCSGPVVLFNSANMIESGSCV